MWLFIEHSYGHKQFGAIAHYVDGKPTAANRNTAAA